MSEYIRTYTTPSEENKQLHIKWARRFNRSVITVASQMAKKHVKGCSVLFIITEMRAKLPSGMIKYLLEWLKRKPNRTKQKTTLTGTRDVEQRISILAHWWEQGIKQTAILEDSLVVSYEMKHIPTLLGKGHTRLPTTPTPLPDLCPKLGSGWKGVIEGYLRYIKCLLRNSIEEATVSLHEQES